MLDVVKSVKSAKLDFGSIRTTNVKKYPRTVPRLTPITENASNASMDLIPRKENAKRIEANNDIALFLLE